MDGCGYLLLCLLRTVLIVVINAILLNRFSVSATHFSSVHSPNNGKMGHEGYAVQKTR